jgi:hypothetical protein
MSGEIAGKVISVSQRVQFYTKPLETPTGKAKGLKVYKNVMHSCVIYLN